MSLSWLVLVPLLTLGASIVAVIGLLLTRRSAWFKRHFSQNEIAGLLFSVMGIVYGALLAFVVFATWETFAAAQQAVVAEAANLVEVYRDTEVFAEPQRSEAQAGLRTYLNTVISNEWASHGNLTEHTTPDLLNPVWDIFRGPAGAADVALTPGAVDRLHDLDLQRHLRHLSGEATLPWIFWPLLLLGGAIVILFSYTFHQESLMAHALMTGVSTAMLVGILLLIFSLNQPFTGPVTVSQQPFLHALQMFHAIDLGT